MKDNKFDIVIIGSGLGGLACAYILSKEGFNVCVLEKNQQFGGSLQDFKHDGVTFDTGVHYVGGLDEGQSLHQYFKYFNIIDKLKYKRMDADGFEYISYDNDDNFYKYGIGRENFVETLAKEFPEERENLKKFIQQIKEIGLRYPFYHLTDKTYTDTLNFDFLDVSITQYLDKLFKNNTLKSIIGGNNLLYAGNEENSTLYEHALITNSYVESAYRFIGGAGQIAKYLVRNIRANGGVVKRYQNVEKFNAKDKEIISVQLKTGERYFAQKFISNIHPTATLSMMEGANIRNAYINRLNSIKNSSSAYSMHIVLKDKQKMPYQNYNHYHYKDYNVWNGESYNHKNWPLNYMVFTPINPNSDKWAESVIAIAYMNFEDVEQWKNTENIAGFETDRGTLYEAFKQKHNEIFLKEVYKVMPELKGNIQSINVSTPLTYRDYLYSPAGSIYGYAKDYKNPLKAYISPQTKLDNLYFTGQNVNLHGVLGVTISAFMTCGEILGKPYLYNKVKII